MCISVYMRKCVSACGSVSVHAEVCPCMRKYVHACRSVCACVSASVHVEVSVYAKVCLYMRKWVRAWGIVSIQTGVVASM